MARIKRVQIEPKQVPEAVLHFVIDFEQVKTIDDVRAVLAYHVRDICIPLDGDLNGIAHLVKRV